MNDPERSKLIEVMKATCSEKVGETMMVNFLFWLADQDRNDLESDGIAMIDKWLKEWRD